MDPTSGSRDHLPRECRGREIREQLTPMNHDTTGEEENDSHITSRGVPMVFVCSCCCAENWGVEPLVSTRRPIQVPDCLSRVQTCNAKWFFTPPFLIAKF